MATIMRSKIGYLLTNFTSNFVNRTCKFHKTQQVLFNFSPLLYAPGQGVKMPSLSPTMTEGKIVKWLKKEGDVINPGDVLCDIETDKAVMSMEAEEEGILAKIVIPENSSNIKVGSLICVMVGPDEDWKNVEIPGEEGVSVSESSPPASTPSNEPVGKADSQETVLSGTAIPISMPSLSPTMTSGTIVKWLKKEGDPVAPGDVLCEIQTDKAVMSMEVEEEGTLAKIILPDDSKDVQVGTLIAVIVPEGEDWKNVNIPVKEGKSTSTSSPSASTPPTSIETTAEKSTQEFVVSGNSIPITMPSLSPTMTAGTIVQWLKKEGDPVAPGDVLCEIQTDKAVMSMEVEEEGILAKIILPNDSKDVQVGTLIAVIVPEGEDWKNVSVSAPKPCTTEKKPVDDKKSQDVSHAPTNIDEGKGKSFGPAVRVLLASYQLEADQIKSSGRSNRLLKEDVLKYIADNKLVKKPQKAHPPTTVPVTSKKPETVPPKKMKDISTGDAKYIDIEISNIRQVIGKRLMQSKRDIPHAYSLAKCNVDGLLKTKETFSADGIKVSVNDLLIKAVALALQMTPKANAICLNNEIKLSEKVDISVAVATDSGLFTPIIKSANLKSVQNISQEIRELAGKAKSGKLKPDEYQGGTFTISNLGMFGVTHFKAIINPPQCGILAVGGVNEILNHDLETVKQMILTLSYDSRAMQDHEASEFMAALKYFIENPTLITLGVNRSINSEL